MRTQAIVGLPVIKPSIPFNSKECKVSLVDHEGKEHYYEDPIQESLKCLDLVCSSFFRREDYYWNAIYSPFPGTPLGDYSIKAGFTTGDTASQAYLFSSESGLNCFSDLISKRQLAFSLTSNFFAHFKNGKDLMSLFFYGRTNFDLDGFSCFVSDQKDNLLPKDQISTYGLIPNISKNCLESFLITPTKRIQILNLKKSIKNFLIIICTCWMVLCWQRRWRFTITKIKILLIYLIFIGSKDYTTYDNCYHMNYIPEKYANYLTDYLKK